jgi:hypothetical protein
MEDGERKMQDGRVSQDERKFLRETSSEQAGFLAIVVKPSE